jgi:hypothetical protein
MRLLLVITMFAALSLSSGCERAKAGLTPAEQALAAKAGVEPAIAAQAKDLGVSIERLMGMTADFNEVAANGIVVNTKPKDGREVLTTLRQRLAGTAYHAYLRDDAHGYGPDQVAVLKADDHAYLALVRTDAINYDRDHEAVMARYRQWEKQYDLKLIGAGQDWMEAEIRKPPANGLAFAKEVYEFCPDIVDQGTNDVAALASEMERTQVLYLWWD